MINASALIFKEMGGITCIIIGRLFEAAAALACREMQVTGEADSVSLVLYHRGAWYYALY